VKCLLVDDEAGIRDGFAALLRLRGHDVRTAADVASAMAQLGDHDFDLILTDWRLPDGTAAPLLASSPAPVVAISGHPDEVTRSVGQSARLLAVLAKPVMPEQLLQLMAHAAQGQPAASSAASIDDLPADLRCVLHRALHLLGDRPAELVDDGTFVTLRAPWPGDHLLPAFAPLGGDLRVLAPDGQNQLRLRWCRDGRPDAGLPVVSARAAWPRSGAFGVDFHGCAGSAPDLGAAVDRAVASFARGQVVHLLNVPSSIAEVVDAHRRAGRLPAKEQIGPRLPQELVDLWR
jgi:CheY-like chemotaxis protein